MAFTNARIIDVEGFSVVVADKPVGSMLTYYSGLGSKVGKWDEIALVCASRERAEEILAKNNEILLGYEFTVHRENALLHVAKALRGMGVIYERYAEMGDDAGIRRAFPPPEGIDVRYRWDGAEQVHRIDAFTEKKGMLVTRTVVLSKFAKQFREDLEKAYARFVRTSPAPKGAGGTLCGEHVARIIRRLEKPATAQYRRWIGRLKETPLHDRGNIPPLVLPGWALDRTITSVTLLGTRGRDEIDAHVSYRSGNAVRHATMTIRAELPDTVVASLTGQTADVVWGASELGGLRIARHLESVEAAGQAPTHSYLMEIPMVLLPEPGDLEPDEEKAMEKLERNYGGYTFQKVLRSTLSSMPASWLLHVLRTLRVDPLHVADLDYIPGAEARRIRFSKETKSVTLDESDADRFATLWPEKIAEAA